MTLLPLFLNLEGRRVVVVGAGPVARRKTRDLIEAKANVEVIAPDAEIDGAICKQRNYKRGDLEGAWLAVSATGDVRVAKAMREEAEEKRVWLLAVDDLAHTCVYSSAVIRRDPLVVAISSTGEAPALVRLMREVIEQALPDPSWVDVARTLRQKWKQQSARHESRFAELVRTVYSMDLES
jgi:siroheme synthase-like protein